MFCKLKKLIFVFGLLAIFSLSVTAYTPQFADEGRTIPLRWRNKTIQISIADSFSKQAANINPDSNVADAIAKSFEAWEKVAAIKFEIKPVDKQSISRAGKVGDGLSLITNAPTPENLLLFSGENTETAAYTRVFFNRRGEISEADIVLNPYARFSTDGSIGTFDIQATLTHEIGHLLGLDHSTVSASSVFAHQGKNGTYSLPGFSYRTLAQDDVTAIRDLYGAEVGNEECCGILQGRIALPKQIQSKDIQLWLEESQTGKVISTLELSAIGKFKTAGLSEGRYRVFAQSIDEQFAAAELGEIEIAKSKTTIYNERFTPQLKDFDFKFLGFNGQISDSVIPVNKGNTYLIYFAGKNIDSRNFEIGFNSPFLTVNNDSLRKHDYGQEHDVYSVAVTVNENAPFGDYSLYFRSRNGKSDFVIGSVSVDENANSWTHQSF